MWSGWAERLADDLESATGTPLRGPLFAMLGYDAGLRRALGHGALIATPMARLRDLTAATLAEAGLDPVTAESALVSAWHAPDPVGLAHPLTDLPALFDGLHAGGRAVAVVTSDDRRPTIRTLEALGVLDRVDAIVCADDGIAHKPAPDAVLAVCAQTGIAPRRTAVIGDSPADIAMGRRAGAGLVIGVLSGVADATALTEADVVLDSIADLHITGAADD